MAFLSHAAAVTLLLPWGNTAAGSPPPGAGSATLAQWAKALASRPDMAELGQCCVEQGAAEADPRVLVARLNEALGERRLRCDSESPAALRSALRTLQRHEFVAGDVVRVDGWVLCRSEARGYALSAIAARGA